MATGCAPHRLTGKSFCFFHYLFVFSDSVPCCPGKRRAQAFDRRQGVMGGSRDRRIVVFSARPDRLCRRFLASGFVPAACQSWLNRLCITFLVARVEFFSPRPADGSTPRFIWRRSPMRQVWFWPVGKGKFSLAFSKKNGYGAGGSLGIFTPFLIDKRRKHLLLHAWRLSNRTVQFSLSRTSDSHPSS